MASKLITAPTVEPITRQEAKLHLRIIADVTDVTPHPEDAMVDALIAAARQGAETATGRALLPQTWELALDEFATEIHLLKAPLASVTSVKYVDADGVLRTLDPAAYLADSHSTPGRLTAAYGTSWPSPRSQPNAVLVRYEAGYANAGAVPQEIKQWMLLRIGMLYENRESVAVGVSLAELPHVDCLLDAYKIWCL
jgi:uncharacterized phiE125 gp8 family phage protein